MNMNTAFPQGKNNYPYDLTIGMITKNDVTLLTRCLESMKPLREALKCQLIITDTGSTDGTRELAQKEADVFLDFVWCDDFSKARNTGVEKAQGRWFFYVDSDHGFDDSYQALVDFIQSPQGQNPNTPFASITVRNYYGSTTSHTLTHKDTTNCLLVNFSKGNQRFQGRIHESIPLPDVQAPHVPLLLHHWGYVDAKPQEKSQRNLAILLETIEEDPFDLKQHLQYMKDQINPTLCRQHLQVLEGILEKPEAKSRGNYPLLSFLCLIFQSSFYLKQKEYDLCGETILKLQERLEKSPSFLGTVLEVETLGLAYALSSVQEENLSPQREAFLAYQKGFYAFQQSGKHDYAIYYDYNYTAPLSFHKEELAFIQEEIQQGNKEEALALLTQSTAYEVETTKGQRPHTKSYVTACLSVEAFSLVAENLHFLQENPNPTTYYLFQTAIEEGYTEKTAFGLPPLFADLGKNPVDAYTALCHYRGQDYKWQDCPQTLSPFFQKDKDYPHSLLFADLFYGYVKHKQAPSDYLSGLNCEFLPEMVKHLAELHPDFFSLVLESIQSDDFAISTVKEEQIWAHLGYIVLSLLGKALAQDSPYLSYGKEILPCFQNITQVMKHYIETVYNPNILCAEGIAVLSQEEAFGYYCSLALAQRETEELQYIRLLKETISICPSYKSLVYFLIAQCNPSQGDNTIQSGTEAPSPQNAELSALAVTVKKNIIAFIQNGNLSTAKLLLEKYQAIQPNDPELPELLRRCGIQS